MSNLEVVGFGEEDCQKCVQCQDPDRGRLCETGVQWSTMIVYDLKNGRGEFVLGIIVFNCIAEELHCEPMETRVFPIL